MGIWSIGSLRVASHTDNRELESTFDDDSFELRQSEDRGQPPRRSPVLRRIAVHDRYQLELKLGYPLAPGKQTRYLIDTYLFLPASLGINSSSYTSRDFYRDIQTYIRMKTPSFLVEQILAAPDSPLRRCEMLLGAEGGEHPAPGLKQADEQLLRDSFRVLRAVLKSSFRRALAPLQHPPTSGDDIGARLGARLATLIEQADELERRYRDLGPQLIRAGASADLLRSYHLADESISVLIEELLLQLHELVKIDYAQRLPKPAHMQWQRQLRQRAQAEIDYRRVRGYPSVLGPQNSEELLQRLSVLKKYTSSVLWLSTSTRREGGTLEQVLFASAAGVSMVFATLVAFYAQSIYGQLSIPVFLVLVIAYMFKDRIKELGRAFSTHILSRRLYDYRTSIQTQDGERDLGYVREKMIHVRPQGRERTVPPAVMAARQNDPHYEPELFGRPEVVVHYAKQVTLRKDAFRYLAEDGLLISAINDITRLDIRSFLRKMDNPYEDRLVLRDDKVERVRCLRTYPLNLISVFGAEDGATTCERTLVVLNRKGIVRIEQFEGPDSAPR